MKDLLKNKAKAKAKEFKLERPCSAFIPYACHYDKNTILSANGELIQVLRISGLSEQVVAEKIDLRSIIRKSIVENIGSKNFAIWIHTVRRKVNLDPPAHFNSIFARDTHETWCQKNYWHDKYVNELYITIAHQGESFEFGKQSLFNMISAKRLEEHHVKFIEQSFQNLTQVVDKMLDTFSIYGANRLTIKHDRLGSRSEILEFFNKIIYRYERRMELPITDLSEYFSHGFMAFANHSFEVVEHDKKYFGSILSVKDYQDFSEKVIDGLLKAPVEFIITQTIIFEDSKIIKKTFSYMDYIMHISGDEWLREKSGLKDFMESDQQKSSDYCTSQLTIMISGDSLGELNFSIAKIHEILSKMGVVAIKEDLNMEQLFWSQLPCNFKFLVRERGINTKKVATFASLHNSPSGKLTNKWGNSVALFRLQDSTPFFFNFHDGESGHTLICGQAKAGKATLANFLLNEASKYDPRILFIDQFANSELIIKAIGGKYHHISIDNNNSNCRFNPLLLQDTPQNRDFLISWFGILLNGNEHTIDVDKISSAVTRLYTLPQEQRQMKNCHLFFDDNNILAELSIWYGEGKYARLFDNEIDSLDLRNHIDGYGADALIEIGNKVLEPVIAYLLYWFNNSLDGSPAMLLLNDANSLLQNQQFGHDITEWLDYLTKKNAIGIFIKNIDANEPNILPIEKIVTKLFLPDSTPSKEYTEVLKLNNIEVEKIRNMKTIFRHFMIKQSEKSYIAELNLDGLDYALPILSGQEEHVAIINSMILEYGDDPASWVDPYYQKVEEILKQKNKKFRLTNE